MRSCFGVLERGLVAATRARTAHLERTRIKPGQMWRDGARHSCSSHSSFVSLQPPSHQTNSSASVLGKLKMTPMEEQAKLEKCRRGNEASWRLFCMLGQL